MKEFPDKIVFKYSWRTYQQRVLDELEKHLGDNKLHIVAPPGSGKTVLGLEVMLRLNKPTLILAPTLAVRDQWIERFCELFLQVDSTPEWISKDLYAPKFMTVSTYQGLHAAFNNLKTEEEEEGEEEQEAKKTSKTTSNRNANSIVNALKKLNVKTIIVDEAHHLKKEWWKSLDYLEDNLKPVIVGLTATPPYDVSGFEWGRYISLNGPIDDEIFVPELVAEGDLCPHQDYIYFNMPAADERGTILEMREKVNVVFQKLRKDEELVKDIEQLPFIIDPITYLEWIYENLEVYISCIVLINDYRGAVDNLLLEVIGNIDAVIPPMNYAWMEKLLNFYCFKARAFIVTEEDVVEEDIIVEEEELLIASQEEEEDDEDTFDDKIERLIRRLRRYGAMEHRQICFSSSNKESAFLTSSINKLGSILDIVNFEHRVLGADLRMVILSDYIRKEYHVQKDVNDSVISKLGVIPIFEHLRRHAQHKRKMGVLTGSVVFIPSSAKKRFTELFTARNAVEAVLNPLQYDDAYLEVRINDISKKDIIYVITRLFEEGFIEVLIGTKSLLGEGWDAPSINSLILASVVGSFVSSNQMRGRAIRSQRGNPYKTANIWHLVCLDPYVEDGGNDRTVLSRRFKGFVGISNHDAIDDVIISNGTGRLGLPSSLQSEEEIREQNNYSFYVAKQRSQMKERWESAIKKGVHLVHTITIPFIPVNSRETHKEQEVFYTKKTIRYLRYSIALALFTIVGNQIATLFFKAVLWGGVNLRGIVLWGANVVMVTMFYKLIGQYRKNRKLAKKYVDISSDVKNIAIALVDSLCAFDFIKTPKDKVKIIAKVYSSGDIYCVLQGVTVIEGNLFVDCMRELLSPINNPRYVIERRSFLAYANSQHDYHAVPTCLGSNKKMVEYFAQRWGEVVGPHRIIFTRTLEGRKELLRSRMLSLSNQLEKEYVKEENVWI